MTCNAVDSCARARQAGALALLMCLMAIAAPPARAFEQDAAPAPATTMCGQPVAPPARLPPDGSGPVVYLLALCFSAQGNVSLVGTETDLH